MTYQIPETLEWNGAAFAMFTLPLEPFLASPNSTPPIVSSGFGVRRRYVGMWRIDDEGQLFLTGFDPERTFAQDLEPIDAVHGELGLTRRPGFTAFPVRRMLGFCDVPVPEAVKVTEAADPFLTTWYQFSTPKMWLSLTNQDTELLDGSGGERIVAESMELIIHRRSGYSMTEPPIPWPDGRTDPVQLSGASPVDTLGRIDFDRLWGLWLRPRLPINSAGLWQRHGVSVASDDGTRRLLRNSYIYFQEEAGDDFLDLGSFDAFVARWRPLRLDEVVPGADQAVPASWFTGELRLVSTRDEIIDSREFTDHTYQWSDFTFAEERFVEIVDGHVTGERLVHR